MRAHPPRQGGPADKAQDDRDEEKPLLRAPRVGDERGQRHEQRDRRNGADRVRHHLDEAVDPAAVEPGYPADDQRQHKGDEHADGADRQRRVDGVEGPREDVLAR